jgi:hypothetical protein
VFIEQTYSASRWANESSKQLTLVGEQLSILNNDIMSMKRLELNLAYKKHKHGTLEAIKFNVCPIL